MGTVRRSSQLYQSLVLILLSLFFLPFNLYILFSSYVLQVLSPFARARRGKLLFPKRVLISGTNNAVGLALARNLHLRGHYVIGADHEKYGLPGTGRWSKSIRRFYKVPGPSTKLGAADYMHGLLEIVKREEIEIFISCAAFTTAGEDAITKSIIENLTDCKCIAFDSETTARLANKTSFLELAKSIGLRVPEIHSVTSRDQIHQLLRSAKQKETSFTLTKARLNKPRVDASGNSLLPRRTASQTYQFVSQISVSDDDPYVLEEHVTGEEYSSFVLMMGGFIEAFVACLEPQGTHIIRLQTNSPLYYAILRLTKHLTTGLPESFSGPLTFHFRVQMLLTTSGFEKRLIPRACIPKIGLPSLLVDSQSRNSITKLQESKGALRAPGISDVMFSSQGNQNVYWIATDFLALVLLPVYEVLRWRKGLNELCSSCKEFIEHILFWKEATFVLWDPLPTFWQYSVYWPSRIALAVLYGEEWNVLDETTNELRYDE